MGRFVNPDNSAFQVALNSRIYVDKTGLIEYTNSVLNTTNAYICNSRPRRFGKSYAANMLAAYYSKGADSEKMFSELEIGKNEALLPKSEQVPGETYTVGQTTKIFVVDVKEGTKGPKIMISRTHPGLVRRLFETEVPEIFDGTIEIKSISREAGSRTKIAVLSKDEDVDPVGSCIGPRGQRVSNIVDALGGEKIDIVKYSDDPAEFVAAALAPSDVVNVEILDEGAKSCRATVPDDQLSLAIGNKGQNVRLAAKLTNWKIDIKPESGFYEGAQENE